MTDSGTNVSAYTSITTILINVILDSTEKVSLSFGIEIKIDKNDYFVLCTTI